MAAINTRALFARFTPALVQVWREGALPWRTDALAGFTVAIVALPLAMALGIASGAAPNQGLITAVVAVVLRLSAGPSRASLLAGRRTLQNGRLASERGAMARPSGG
jgi:MFS superfamily sulfate permease-like transporter